MGRSTSGGPATRTTSKPSGTVSTACPGCCADGQPASAPTPRETPANAQAARRTELIMHASGGCGLLHADDALGVLPVELLEHVHGETERLDRVGAVGDRTCACVVVPVTA